MEIDSKIDKLEKIDNNLKQLMQETTPAQTFVNLFFIVGRLSSK